MPEVEISIGGRIFEVACQDGEEHFLHAAAKLLDTEATALTQHMGRMSEARLLLMAGLMLADKMSGVQDQQASLKQKLGAQEQLIAELRARSETKSDPSQSLGALVAQFEALADTMERSVS